MKDFFQPDDFTSAIKYSTYDEECKIKCAEYANKKINGLIKSWPVVYDSHSYMEGHTRWIDHDHHNSSKKARLAFIEEIVKEPCKHEPDIKMENLLFMTAKTPELYDYAENKYKNIVTKCKSCGVELKATWSEKNGK